MNSKGPVSQFLLDHFKHFNAAALVDAAREYDKQLADGKKMMINRPQVYRLRKQQKQPVEGYFFVTRDNEIKFKEVAPTETT